MWITECKSYKSEARMLSVVTVVNVVLNVGDVLRE